MTFRRRPGPSWEGSGNGAPRCTRNVSILDPGLRRGRGVTRMTSPITTERHDDVLVIISNNPPVNALGAAVRQGLEAGIKQGLADASIKAMVIRCEGRTFFAGADITEFGKPMQEPGLPTLVDQIEASD